MGSVSPPLSKQPHRFNEAKDGCTRRISVLDPHDEISLEILGKDSYVGHIFIIKIFKIFYKQSNNK